MIKTPSLVTNVRSFKLKKVAAHMAVAALLSVTAVQATAQVVLTTGGFGNLDGLDRTVSGLGGFLITGDSRFSGAATNVTFGKSEVQSLVHNFNTTGGAGSGGGAGLGGAFFVDAGAALTVINTDFKSNRAQGGTGGSDPALRFYDQTLNVSGASVELPSILVTGQPTLSGNSFLNYNSANGQYSFTDLAVNADSASLIKKDSIAVFDVYNTSAKVQAISSQVVRFDAPVVVTDVLSVGKSNGESTTGFNTTGFTSTGGTVNVNYLFSGYTETYNNGNPNDDHFVVTNVADIAGLRDVSIGAKLVARNSSGIRQIATITGVDYYTDEDDAAANGGRGAATKLRGKVKSITLDNALTDSFANLTAIDIVKAPAFKATQFYTNDARNQVTVTSTLGTFVKDMTVSWEEANGNISTAKVTAVSGRTLTLDRALPANVTDFKAVENPMFGNNVVSVPNASGKFSVGQAIFVPNENGIAFEGTVTDITGNLVTVTPKAGSTGNLIDYYNPSVGLALKLSAANVAAGGGAITVPYNLVGKSDSAVLALFSNRTAEGAGFDEGTTVSTVTLDRNKNTVTLGLSKPVSSPSVDYFKLFSPLKMGGSMNNLSAPVGSRNPNGDAGNGVSANYISSLFNDSEGVDGTNGGPAGEANTGAGFSGGDGGNGSSGLPVNFWLIYDLTAAIFSIKTATIDVAAAAADMAEAIVPDPVVGLAVELPDPLKIAAATAGVFKASIDLGFAITDTVLATANLAYWAAQLGQGLAGLGGAGGDGGEASGGADFFGGGAGGNGGDGGNGAISISDGGDGGSGGRGGDGGFGAGGGQGGAGGQAGANGNAAGGDPGDGGYAGFAAGDGANGNGMFGGGGDGLGGSIFVRTGGTLLIQGNAMFDLNYVAGGSTTSQFGEAGYGAGTDLFMMKGSNVTLEPGLGKVIEFNGSISDDSMATNDGYENASGDGSDITIRGAGGLVRFNGENTYSGHTIIEGATLTALVGTGVHNDSLIRFNGSGNMTPNIDPANAQTFNTVTSTLSLASTGTFLLQEDYSRRAGVDPAETAWTGSGGFASGKAFGELTVVNLGKLNDEGLGQALTWGRDGFFVPAESGQPGAGFSGVLTFGSEHSLGAVQFTNNVNLDNRIGRVAVYNTGSFGRSHATLSGNWVNTSGTSSGLIVGDSKTNSPYNGFLFMTGQNNLDSLFVTGGVLSTYNATGAAGKLFKSTGDAVVMADKNNSAGFSHLQLFSNESISNMTVLGGGALTLTKQLNVSGAFSNLGQVTILGSRTQEFLDSLTDNSRLAAQQMLKLDYLPEDFSAWNGQLAVAGALNNRGMITQMGDVGVGSIVNSSAWTSFGNITANGNITNDATGTLTVSGNVSTTGIGDVRNDKDWMQVGNLTSARDLLNTPAADMNVTGNLVVSRNLTNTGEITLLGTTHRVGGYLDNDGSAAKLTITGPTEVVGNVTNDGTSLVTGNTTVGGNLVNTSTGVFTVTGNAVVAGGLGNAKTMTLNGTSHSVGADLSNVSTASNLNITGNTGVVGHFTNDGVATVTGDTMVGTSTVVSNVINTSTGVFMVTGNAMVSGNVDNAKTMTLNGTAHRVNGDLLNSTANSVLTISGATDVGGHLANAGSATMSITGASTVGGTVSNGVAGNLTMVGDARVFGNMFNGDGATLSVTGDTHVTGSVSNAINADMFLVGAANTVDGDVINYGNADLTLTATTSNSVGGSLINAATGAMFITGPTTTVAGVLTNDGDLKQTGNLLMTGTRGSTDTVGRVTHNGLWTLGTNALLKANDLVGTGLFCLSSDAASNACSGDAKNMTLELASASPFDGVFSGPGSLEKSGNGTLFLTEAQTFTGGLLVSGGTVSVGGANGRMADTLDIVIGSGGTYISNNVDTVRSIVNHGNNSLVVNANLTTTQGVVNNGRTEFNADLTAAQGFVNNGRTEINGDRLMRLGTVASSGVTEVKSGLSGSASGNIELGTSASLKVNQNGDTTYEGSIARTGNDGTSAFFKEGTGTLSVGGSLNVKNITINEGTLALTAANTVSTDARVTVNSIDGRTGTLELIQGDQRFFSLNGAGNIVLGSNNLTVEKGGDFTGAISGSGNLSVLGSTLRVTNVVSQAAYEVSDLSTLNIAGSLSASSMNVASGGELKLGSKDDGTVHNADLTVSGTIHVSGMLTGTGNVSGNTIILDGGMLAPGQSPGILNFNNAVILQSGSTTEMEVMNTGAAAGAGYDQSQFASTLTIESGAILDVKAYGTIGIDDVNRSLALGATVKLFDFAPGQITGVFGRANTDTDVRLLNLATGNAVGLGNLTQADVAAQATTDNERAIYSGLNVSKAGNVVQFYGGRFIENLTAAMAAGTSTRTVFNAYNPESYFSLTDVGQEAAQLALPTWKSDLQGKDQFIAFAGNSTKATRNDENRQSFGLKANHGNIGVVRDLGNRKSVLFTLGNIKANTNSNTLQSSGHGLSAAAVWMGGMDALPNGFWHVGLTHSNVDMSGSRSNLNGNATFNDVGVKTNQFDVGLETRHNFGKSYFSGRTSLALGSTQRAGFNETGYAETLDKMSVQASRVSYNLVNIGMELGTQVGSNTTMFGSLHFQSASLNNKTVSAAFDRNQAGFNVTANSAMSSNSKLMTGLRHKYASGTVFQASVGASQSWERSTDLVGNASLTVPF